MPREFGAVSMLLVAGFTATFVVAGLIDCNRLIYQRTTAANFGTGSRYNCSNRPSLACNGHVYFSGSESSQHGLNCCSRRLLWPLERRPSNLSSLMEKEYARRVSVRESSMADFLIGNRPLPTVDRPPCPSCEWPMWLIGIEPHSPGLEKRTFQCPGCEHHETVIAEYQLKASA